MFGSIVRRSEDMTYGLSESTSKARQADRAIRGNNLLKARQNVDKESSVAIDKRYTNICTHHNQNYIMNICLCVHVHLHRLMLSNLFHLMSYFGGQSKVYVSVCQLLAPSNQKGLPVSLQKLVSCWFPVGLCSDQERLDQICKEAAHVGLSDLSDLMWTVISWLAWVHCMGPLL